MYAKDLSEPKFEYLIKKGENVGTEHLANSKAFIEYSNTMDDVYENIDDLTQREKEKFYLLLMI